MKIEKATFAGGCFWCMIPPFQKLEGVIEVVPGYTGGHKKDPIYEEVSSGKTGNYEAVQISYDPEKITYEKLLEVFWRQIDPTDSEGQFGDRGTQYKTAIFYHNDLQKKEVEESKKALEKSGRFEKIVTEIKKASEFYVAEEYHRNYHKKHTIQYKLYRLASGRDRYLKNKWNKNKN